jgi:hypothetical protein
MSVPTKDKCWTRNVTTFPDVHKQQSQHLNAESETMEPDCVVGKLEEVSSQIGKAIDAGKKDDWAAAEEALHRGGEHGGGDTLGGTCQ